MDAVTIRFKPSILKTIDEALQANNFNSRTEFIREAVRDKLSELNKRALMRKFMKYQGAAHTSFSDKELESVREKLGAKNQE